MVFEYALDADHPFPSKHRGAGRASTQLLTMVCVGSVSLEFVLTKSDSDSEQKIWLRPAPLGLFERKESVQLLIHSHGLLQLRAGAWSMRSSSRAAAPVVALTVTPTGILTRSTADCRLIHRSVSSPG
jgi:hypothetical protein